MKYADVQAADSKNRELLRRLNDIIRVTPELKANWLALFTNVQKEKGDGESWTISISAFNATRDQISAAKNVMRMLGSDPKDLQSILAEGETIEIRVDRAQAEAMAAQAEMLIAQSNNLQPQRTPSEKIWIVAISANIV